MIILDWIRTIPSHMDHAMMQCIVKGAEFNQKIVDDWVIQSQFWQQTGKPLYKRYLKPLNEDDYLILGGFVYTAIMVTLVAKKWLPTAYFPLALGLSTLILSIAYQIARHQIAKHFKEAAWEHIDQIREIIETMTPQNPILGDLTKHQAKLMKTKFNDLKKDFKELNQRIWDFQKDLNSYQNQPTILSDRKKNLIHFLEGMQNKLAFYKKVLSKSETNDESSEDEMSLD